MLGYFCRAYHRTVYSASKAILGPVVAAFSDVISEEISRSVKKGVRDAIKESVPMQHLNVVKSFFGVKP